MNEVEWTRGISQLLDKEFKIYFLHKPLITKE